MSIPSYFGGVLYINNIGFKNLFPCEIDKGEETGRSLRSLI